MVRQKSTSSSALRDVENSGVAAPQTCGNDMSYVPIIFIFNTGHAHPTNMLSSFSAARQWHSAPIVSISGSISSTLFVNHLPYSILQGPASQHARPSPKGYKTNFIVNWLIV
jgi:hypothetical protein